ASPPGAPHGQPRSARRAAHHPPHPPHPPVCAPPPQRRAGGDHRGHHVLPAGHPPLKAPSQPIITLLSAVYHITTTVVLVLYSSKAIDKAATKRTVWWGWAAPDPGFGPRAEVLGRHLCRQVDLLGVGKGLAGERLATEAPPPAFLPIEPAGACRDRDAV